jgi:hypothetical protein
MARDKEKPSGRLTVSPFKMLMFADVFTIVITYIGEKSNIEMMEVTSTTNTLADRSLGNTKIPVLNPFKKFGMNFFSPIITDGSTML